MIGEVQLSEHDIGFPGYFLRLHPIDAAEEADVFCHGKVAVERELLAHVSDMPLYLLMFRADVEASHGPRSGRRLVESGEDVHGGGLTGPVSSEESKDFSPAYGKTDIVDGTERPESLYQMSHLDDVSADGACRCRAIDGRRVEDVLEVFQYRFRTTNAQHPAFVEESHPVAAPHLVEIGGRCHNGDASAAQLLEHVPELLPADGVDTGGGFVQEQHFGTVHQRTAKCQFLLHASGEGPSFAVSEALNLCIDSTDAFVPLFERRPEEGGKESEVLLHGKVMVERKAAGHIPHPPTYIPHLLPYLASCHHSLAAIGQQEGAEDAEQGGLPSPIGTDNPEQFALADGKGDTVQRLYLAVGLRYVANLYHGQQLFI